MVKTPVIIVNIEIHRKNTGGMEFEPPKQQLRARGGHFVPLTLRGSLEVVLRKAHQLRVVLREHVFEQP